MGYKSAKSEICKALNDKLTSLTYQTDSIPVYVDMAPKDVANDTYILIWGYIDSPKGTKMRFGLDASVNLDIITNSDDSVKHESVVNSVKELIHAVKNDDLALTNFSTSVFFEPSTQSLNDLTEDGQIYRTILKYELIVEQK